MAKQPRDYYEVLGVSRSASNDEIRSSYRKLARKYHPDVNKDPDAAKLFAEVQEAYDVLSDTEKRKAYDRFGHAGVGPAGDGGAGPAGWGGFGGGHGRGGRTTWTTHGGGSGIGAEDLTDVFEEIFGSRRSQGPQSPGGSPFDVTGGFRGASGARSQTPKRGQDIEHNVSLTFITAALGGTEQLRLTINGSASTLSVKIPPGIENGSKLRIKGKGQHGGGVPGDLILTVEVGQHPFFRRDGLDLFIDVPITITEAVLGTVVSIPLLKPENGATSLQVKVPPGMSSGGKLRVRGKGISNSAGNTGDYYAVIQIIAPAATDLSDSARQAVSELARELKNPRENAPYADIVDERSS